MSATKKTFCFIKQNIHSFTFKPRRCLEFPGLVFNMSFCSRQITLNSLLLMIIIVLGIH